MANSKIRKSERVGGLYTWNLGERIQIAHDEGDAPPIRGWLEAIDEQGVTIRLPGVDETPTGELLTVPYPPHDPRVCKMITCNPIYYIYGLWITYLDPHKWSGPSWGRILTPEGEAYERRWHQILRDRSLAQPISKVQARGDFGPLDDVFAAQAEAGPRPENWGTYDPQLTSWRDKTIEAATPAPDKAAEPAAPRCARRRNRGARGTLGVLRGQQA